MQVYVVDNDPLICRTLARMLQCDGIAVRTFPGAAAFLDELDSLKFGCVMLDISMPDHSGLDVLSTILREKPPWPVIMVSGSTAVDDAITSFRRGAIHFLRKPFRLEELRSALDEASKIGADRLAAHERQMRARQVHLTGRERQILSAMADGLQTKMIAWQLELSVRTVDMHRSNILAKLSARNAVEAVAVARNLELLTQVQTAA